MPAFSCLKLCCGLTSREKAYTRFADAKRDLQVLAERFRMYCYLLDDFDEALLRREAGGDFEQLRAYLRKRCVAAYEQKALFSDSI